MNLVLKNYAYMCVYNGHKCENCVYMYMRCLSLCSCVSCIVQPPPLPPTCPERNKKVMSVYGIDVHTALTAKVLNLLKKTLYMNFFVYFCYHIICQVIIYSGITKTATEPLTC